MFLLFSMDDPKIYSGGIVESAHQINEDRFFSNFKKSINKLKKELYEIPQIHPYLDLDKIEDETFINQAYKRNQNALAGLPKIKEFEDKMHHNAEVVRQVLERIEGTVLSEQEKESLKDKILTAELKGKGKLGLYGIYHQAEAKIAQGIFEKFKSDNMKYKTEIEQKIEEQKAVLNRLNDEKNEIDKDHDAVASILQKQNN